MSRDRAPVSLVLPTALTGVLLAATGLVVATAQEPAPPRADPTVESVQGLVVGETGKPVPGASVWVGTTRVDTGRDGRFSIPHTGPAVVTAAAPGQLPRTTTMGTDRPGRITLTGQADRTVSMRFGGDVMVARRYYTGSPATPPVLSPSAGPSAIADVFSGVQPFLDDSDLSVVNLEAALVAKPWTASSGKRPPTVHQTKDFVITSATALASALSSSGVDVVSLSNNHTYDGLDAGVTSTIAALDKAGVRHFGAGRTVKEAWRPAYVDVKGQRIAFVGCTTVDGHAEPVHYVADAKHGGAALCDTARLRTAVKAARKKATYVVVTIHGGVEYRRSQTGEVRALARTAHKAGARLVVGSHPHVVGGIQAKGPDLFFESLGNLAADQELWSTLPSYLARVDVRGGATVAAGVDPIVLDSYRPRPAGGALAASVSRMAAGLVEGATRLDGTHASVQVGATAAGPAPATVRLSANEVRRLSPGWWVAGAPDLSGRVEVGTDRLFGTGGFEDDVVGPSRRTPLWSLAKYGQITSDASCAPDSGVGLLLARSPLSQEPAVATTKHRVPVAQGQKVTLSARVRYASAGSRLEVHWYRDPTGPSTATASVDVPPGTWDAGACQQVRYDVTVPPGTTAAQVFVVLDPPHGGQTVRRLAVDDVMLVDWAPQGRSGRRYDVVSGPRATSVRLAGDPGAPVDAPLAP